MSCKQKTAKSATRQQQHLDHYSFYQKSLEERRKRNRADTVTSALATRMLNALANSAPSERAFSAMKATHIQARNCLLPERVNKLLFIQINGKVLARRTQDMSRPQNENEDSAEKINSANSEIEYQMMSITARIMPEEPQGLQSLLAAESIQQTPHAVQKAVYRPNSGIRRLLNHPEDA